MAALLAHQIRTLLSAAMLYAANLANRTLKPESRSQFQQKLMARLQDPEKQINDILLFARNGDNQVVAPLRRACWPKWAGPRHFASSRAAPAHEAPGARSLPLLANSSTLAGAINNLIANAQQAGADRSW